VGVSGVATRVCRAEIVAALSLGIDLGFGQPMEHVLRQCQISLRIADDLGLDDQQGLSGLSPQGLEVAGQLTGHIGDLFATNVVLNQTKHDTRELLGILRGRLEV
jgi:hypothetical protein